MNVMILMLQIFNVIANENVCKKSNELEFKFLFSENVISIQNLFICTELHWVIKFKVQSG